jgi:hypothetical protein
MRREAPCPSFGREWEDRSPLVRIHRNSPTYSAQRQRPIRYAHPRRFAAFADMLIGCALTGAALCDPLATRSGGKTRTRQHVSGRIKPPSWPCKRRALRLWPRPSAVGAAAAAGHHDGRAKALMPRRAPRIRFAAKSTLQTPLAALRAKPTSQEPHWHNLMASPLHTGNGRQRSPVAPAGRRQKGSQSSANNPSPIRVANRRPFLRSK